MAVMQGRGSVTGDVDSVEARFDDPRADAPRSLLLSEPYRIMVARTLDEVRSVVSAAEGEADSGGWVAGFVSYEAGPAFDEALVVAPASPTLPLVWFAAFRSASRESARRGGDYALGRWEPEIDEDAYRDAIRSIQELITAGDTYQTNFTFRLRGSFEGDARTFYADLLDAQRGGYHAYLVANNHTIVSASPELFFRWDGRRIETRPMKGTMPRGRWEREDREERERLLTSGKDRAENVMIVDLLRSDLGRLARFGTVKVEQLFEIERFETVWQMTSTIAAETRPAIGLVDVFEAMFPCGSVTGAPKSRTMEIIQSLEASPRGVYCGAIGVLAPPASGRPKAEFSVAIRTVVIDNDDGSAEYGVGGGVVHESTAASEYEEAMVKARVLNMRRAHVTLLETMRWDPGTGIWMLDRHLNRLRASARYFGIELPEAAVGALLASIHSVSPLRVRLLVPQDGEPTIETNAMGGSPAILGLALDDVPIDRADPFRYHKTTRRDSYEAASRRHPTADDVLLFNDRREAVETTRSNIAVRLEDEWLTPPLSAGCLPGTYREELIDHGALREHPLFIEDVMDADELAVINSVRGWRAAKLQHGA